METLIEQFTRTSLESTDGDVQILVYSPNMEYDVLYTYYTYKSILEQSPIFKKWFEKVHFYGDYIEIDNNLMLFNKSDEYSYSLIINANGSRHIFGTYNPPLIKDILEFLKGKRDITLLNHVDFIECLKLLQLNTN